MISMTPMQAELLAFIKSYMAENNNIAPSFEEMKVAIGLASKSGVHRLITGLEERGHIVRRTTPRARKARAIEITNAASLEAIPTRALIAELARRGELNRKAAA